MPPEAKDNGNGFYVDTGTNTPMCNYQCKDNVQSVDSNPKCLSDFDLFISNLGGI